MLTGKRAPGLELLSVISAKVLLEQIRRVHQPLLVHCHRVDVPVFVEGDGALTKQQLFRIIIWTCLWATRETIYGLAVYL